MPKATKISQVFIELCSFLFLLKKVIRLGSIKANTLHTYARCFKNLRGGVIVTLSLAAQPLRSVFPKEGLTQEFLSTAHPVG